MGGSPHLHLVRRIGAIALALALGMALLPPAAAWAFDIGDNFDDNIVNKAIWGKIGCYHNGIQKETNQRLQYTVASPTRDDSCGQWLTWGTGPYASNWEVRTDVVNAVAPKGYGQLAAFEIYVISCGPPYTGLLYTQGYSWGTNPVTRGFYAEELTITNGVAYFSGSADTGDLFGGAPLSGTLKISFNATDKVLVAEYDIGNGWQQIGSFGVVPGAGSSGGDWRMTDADSFCFAVGGWSRSVAVAGGKLYGDNFFASGLIRDKILLLQPNGGEVIPSGLDSYRISWYRPPGVAAVRLQYSLDKGSTWKAIDPALLPGDFYDWHVPTPLANKTGCLVRAIAFDAANRQIGNDPSDFPFTIEVARIHSPTAGDPPLVSGSHAAIKWTTNETAAPVTGIRLAFTLDGGATWRPIDTSGDSADDGEFNWLVPAVPIAKTRCKVKLTLKDGTGRTVGADVSDGFFTITPGP